MPTLPSWAVGGRIIWDDDLGLVFIRKGLRRSPWAVYTRSAEGLRAIAAVRSYGNLEDARKAAMEVIGASLQGHIMALHPGAIYKHLGVERPRTRGYYEGRMHACGIPMSYETADSHKSVTCPLCLAVLAEDLNLKAAKMGPEKFEKAREEIRNVRAWNAFGKLVTDDTVTEHDI